MVGHETINRTPEVLVLFGSQTGNSEQAAEKLSAKLNESKDIVRSRHMQLDDFLELERAKWTQLVVIITSSYGVGQAPLGCYRFRKLCDKMGSNKFLSDITYAMLGLGDSKYTTFFQNPTAIDRAMTTAGATRLGPLGKADASAVNPNQSQIIQDWLELIHPMLLEHVKTVKAKSAHTLEKAQADTLNLCYQVFDDFPADHNNNSSAKSIFTLTSIAVMIAVLSSLYYFFLSNGYIFE